VSAPRLIGRLGRRLATVGALLAHFARGRRFFLLPMLIVLLLTAVLLLLTGGLSYVAPFLYTLF
jgi:hypothetical protein